MMGENATRKTSPILVTRVETSQGQVSEPKKLLPRLAAWANATTTTTIAPTVEARAIAERLIVGSLGTRRSNDCVARAIDKLAEPQLEHEQRPDMRAAIGALAQVIVDQRTHGLR